MLHKLWGLQPFILLINNMKKLIIFALLLLSSFNCFGQWIFGKNPILNRQDWDKKRVSWGYYLGFNSYNFKIDYNAAYYQQIQEYQKEYGKPDFTEIQVKSSTGFNVGLIGNLRLMEYLDLRFEPGLFHTKRELMYPKSILYHYLTEKYQETPTERELQNASTRQVSSTYIHMPLLLKFTAKRTGNIRPYVIGGFSLDLDLTSNSSSDKDNSENTFRLNQWSANYELGAGIDIYFQYFKFSPSIRGVFGLQDELIRDRNPESPWTSNITSMKTQGLFINFTFH